MLVFFFSLSAASMTWGVTFFILVINQLDAQNLFYNKFISCLYIVEELETNLMSLVIFITFNICSTYFEH